MQYTIHHVAISVADADTSIAFYKHLGFSQFHVWQADDKNLTITHLKNGAFILELFCYQNPQPAPATIFALENDLPVIGTKHFGLKVDSVEEAREELIRKGLIDGALRITEGRTGVRYFFITDPDGILVEIAEDNRHASQPADS